jgi:hypothetical protein
LLSWITASEERSEQPDPAFARQEQRVERATETWCAASN